jgi:phosphoribosylformimino-5-aminoimidazole carboxamide ribotide isomerase
MTKFRPCIDLHSGQVKQIVGGTLSNVAEDLKTNYVSKLPAGHYSGLYQKHDLRGGHVVKLGPGNEEAAQEAVRAWPNGLQLAGGITDKNAQYWIDQGAEKVSNPHIVAHSSRELHCWWRRRLLRFSHLT